MFLEYLESLYEQQNQSIAFIATALFSCEVLSAIETDYLCYFNVYLVLH